VANSLGGKKRGGSFKVADFLPKFGPAKRKRKTMEEMQSYMIGLTLAGGGTVSAEAMAKSQKALQEYSDQVNRAIAERREKLRGR
jgi:hypothetical protein